MMAVVGHSFGEAIENFKFFDVEIGIRVNHDLFAGETFNVIDQAVFFTM